MLISFYRLSGKAVKRYQSYEMMAIDLNESLQIAFSIWKFYGGYYGRNHSDLPSLEESKLF